MSELLEGILKGIFRIFVEFGGAGWRFLVGLAVATLIILGVEYGFADPEPYRWYSIPAGIVVLMAGLIWDWSRPIGE